MNRVLSILLLSFLIIVPISLALDFNAEITPSQRSIYPNETAEFDIKISHDSKDKEFFDVFSPDVIWDIRPEKNLFANPGEELSSKLFIRPINHNPGFYGAPIIIRNPLTNAQKKAFIHVEIKSDQDLKLAYVPALRGSAELNKKIDPRDPVKLIVKIDNLNSKDINQLDIKIRSNSINLDTKTSIKGLEKKILTYDVNLNPKVSPSKDNLRISAFGFDESRNKEYQFDLAPVEFEIIPYGDIHQDISLKTPFLKTIKTITLENTGNTKKRAEPKIKKSFFKDLFTSFSVSPALMEGNYVWIIDLNVGEKQEIVLTTNYWPLFIFVLLLIAVVISYFVFRSPIVMKKTAKILATKEGGISELKIILSIRNRSKSKIHNARIIDLIPNIAEIVKEFELGTLEPNKIMLHDNKGTIVKWTFDFLESDEERLISYRVKNKLSVLEGIDLPPAVIKFEVGPESERSIKSNSFNVRF